MEIENRNQSVCIVVLGDFGRSPRMQYHALSLANEGYRVDVVAYGGSKLHEDVLSKQMINQHLMADLPEFGKYFPRSLVYLLKVIWQSLIVLYTLFSLRKPAYVLVQNPPSIPTLPLVWFYCYLFPTCKLIVDWHNYGYTILSLTLGECHLLVKLCKWCEGFFGAKAYGHFCVTKAMKHDLSAKWNINATVLYDRSSARFSSVTTEQSHSLFVKLMKENSAFGPSGSESWKDFHQNNTLEETRFTIRKDDKVNWIIDRPALIVSSTSWTDDEDFSILLDALEDYEIKAGKGERVLPKIVCVVTGKGPLKSYYQSLIEAKNFLFIEFVTLWLSAEEYPILLASADLGVSLHFSSSGLDLPMKVVDMFSCGLPVCAICYNCLEELVHHNENGLVFKDSQELSQQLQQVTDTSLKNPSPVIQQ
ncbi:ALG1, chitobiosyldiphosphodolichol beta-mannosyltransferase isoform X2 [Tachypleus tridentatus]|uniref:ALG1, chitobiosyldiphosphodolichol beta-mannosyltransferase isoform X2 n=1 Tax=Tachypleus tridentatus TaxID=6853 RepID=UPI003FD3B7D3